MKKFGKPSRLLIFFGSLFFIFAGIVGLVAYYDNKTPEAVSEVAETKTCDAQKQLDQLSSLYEAKLQTKTFQERSWGMAKYVEMENQLPSTTQDTFDQNMPLIEGAQSLRDSLDIEISDISNKILAVKKCWLLDDKTAEEFKNFNKYDAETIDAAINPSTPI